MRKVQFIFVIFSLFLLTSCGFHLRNNVKNQLGLNEIYLTNTNPQNPIAIAIEKEFARNNIKVHYSSPNKDNATILQLGTQHFSKEPVSIYLDGKAAEYRLLYTLNANLIIPELGIYPLQIKAAQTFFDNPATALAKSGEQALIREEIYQNATERLITKILSIQPKIKTNEKIEQ